MKTLLAHPGTQYSFTLAAELKRLRVLLRFHTSLAFRPEAVIGRVLGRLPTPLLSRVANRRIEDFPPEFLRLHPLPELVALGRIHRGADAQGALHRRNESFQKAIPSKELQGADAVIGFDTSAWILTKRCRDIGVPLVLDQSIGHPDSKTAIYERLREGYPSWTEGIEPRRSEVSRAEKEEHDGATIVIAASSFTRRTLIENGVPVAKIRVNPYGVDCSRFSVAPRTNHRPFRFVFVGSITARKGVPLLLEAWRRIRPSDAELWLAGPASSRAVSLIPDLPGLLYCGPLPHDEIPQILQQCDVLVFPSYFEGFGLVILEAMACGIPVITTTATAGPDIYSHGDGGWLTAPGDLEGLVAAMSRCLENPAAVQAAGRRARVIAERSSWASYGDRWRDILQEASATDGPSS